MISSIVVGDRLVGRQTLPIMHPKSSRPMLMFGLVAWSFGLSALWGLSDALRTPFIFLGFYVGYQFVTKSSCKDDQRSCYLYYVSTILLIFYRKLD